MRVYGTSVLKGLLYTLKNFVGTYVEDFRRLNGKNKDDVDHGFRSETEGVVTVQYPDVQMPIGHTYERFRVLPMLLYDELETKDEQGEPERDVRCTACGICSKVCPPQCIWIFQDTNEQGKPVPHPKEFYVDASVCMNCGLCSEFCPFDSIKMDHKFELNVTEERQENYLYDLEKLLVSSDYYNEIRPKANASEIEARRLEAEAKAKKDAARKEAAAKKAAAAKAKKEAEAKAAKETAKAVETESAEPVTDSKPAKASVKKAAKAVAESATETVKVTSKAAAEDIKEKLLKEKLDSATAASAKTSKASNDA